MNVGYDAQGGKAKDRGKAALTTGLRLLSMPDMNRAGRVLILLAVVTAPWLVGLGYPFLYDDVGMICENAFLEDPANLGTVLTGQTLAGPHIINGRRPVVLVTYFLDRVLYGLQPAGWRLTSLALHLGCVALLMGLLWRLTGHVFLASAAGLLFGLHPVMTEAVHAPGFRADVLSLLLVLGFLHGHLGIRSPAVLRRGAGWVCLVLALLSKETAVAAPLLLAMLLVLFPGVFPNEPRTRWIVVAISAGIGTGFFLLWMMLPAELQAVGDAWNGESLRFPQTIYSMPVLWARTLRLLLVPWPLNVTPGFEPVTSAWSLRLVMGLGWLALCGWGAWRARRAAPELALGLGWMAAFFLPVSNLWPLYHPVADRYLYPIAPGFAILTAWLLARQSRAGRRFGLAALAAVYAVLLLLRLGQWASAETLWTAAYFQNPKSAAAATWLGLLREEAGDLQGARDFYQAAVEANPRAASAWINWGILAGKAGHWEESERLLRRAVEIRPQAPLGWHNLAICLDRQGRTEEAAAAVARAAELAPAYGRAKP